MPKRSSKSRPKSRRFIVWLPIVIAVIVALALIAYFTQYKGNPVLRSVERTDSELLYNDVFAQEFVSTNVTVLGARLGMSDGELRALLGEPDKLDKYQFGIVQNWQYGQALGLEQIGVLYHFERGVLTRITLGPAANPLLHGNSTVGKEKEEVYSLFGTPERAYDIPNGRFFVYNDLGLEVYLDRHGESQYAFVYPGRRLPSTAVLAQNKTQYDVTKVILPALISDTTTLCDAGAIFAKDLTSGECKEFPNYCAKPDHWVEITACPSGTLIP